MYHSSSGTSGSVSIHSCSLRMSAALISRERTRSASFCRFQAGRLFQFMRAMTLSATGRFVLETRSFFALPLCFDLGGETARNRRRILRAPRPRTLSLRAFLERMPTHLYSIAPGPNFLATPPSPLADQQCLAESAGSVDSCQGRCTGCFVCAHGKTRVFKSPSDMSDVFSQELLARAPKLVQLFRDFACGPRVPDQSAELIVVVAGIVCCTKFGQGSYSDGFWRAILVCSTCSLRARSSSNLLLASWRFSDTCLQLVCHFRLESIRNFVLLHVNTNCKLPCVWQ